MNPNNKTYDNLTVIKGIGLTTQRKLREVLDVQTFRDLAALTADEIEERLKMEGLIISRSKIDEWIIQARKLADVDPIAREDEWKPFASFVVEFQVRTVEGREERRTAAHYMEGDKSTHWPGIESGLLGGWILAQLGEEPQQKTTRAGPVELSKPSENRVEAEEQTPVAKSPLRVVVTQIQAVQSSQGQAIEVASSSNRSGGGFLRSAEPLALHVSFRLSEPAAAATITGVFYSAQFYASNLTTGVHTYLGDTERALLTAEQVSYTAVLAGISLPPGTYRIRVVTALEGVSAEPGYLEMPLLQAK